MKTLVKIVLFSLVLALLLAIPFTASANTAEPQLKIEAANLSFVDSISILYAVSGENVDMTSVQLLIWTEPKSSADEYVKGSESHVLDSVRTESIGGKDCIVFDCDKLGAHQMTEAVYARAYAEKDGEAIYSDLSKYSVIRYAHNKLGYTGTATENELLKTTLLSLLDYGAAVQLFADYKTDCLPNERFYKVSVDGGKLADDTSDGLYKEGDVVSVKGDISTEHSVTVKKENVKLDGWYGDVIIDEAPSEGLEYYSVGDGTCYVSGLGSCTDSYVVIPRTSPSGEVVVGIKSRAFRRKSHLTGISIPSTVIDIQSSAFSGCDSLQYTVEDGIYYLGNKANPYFALIKTADMFWSYSRINPNTKVIAAEAFQNAMIEEESISLTVPDGVRSICDDAFHYKMNMISVPDTLINLGDYVFRGDMVCNEYDNALYIGNVTNPYLILIKAKDRSISSCEINVNTKFICRTAFYECKNLAGVNLPEGLIKIESNAFYGCESLTQITLPASLKTIGSFAFDYCQKLVEVINKSSLDIAAGYNNHGGVAANALAVHTGESKLDNKNGFLFYSHDGKNYLIGYLGNDNMITLPDGYTDSSYEIYKYAFKNRNDISYVKIPKSVTAIGEKAFSQCYGLKGVEIGEGVTSIHGQAFYNCFLAEIINHSSLEIIAGEDIAYYAIEVHSSESKIDRRGDYSFYTHGDVNYLLGYSGKDSSITLPESYVGESYEIYARAFYKRDNLTSVTLSTGVTKIGESAFQYCNNLSSLTVTESLKGIDEYAFSECNSLVYNEYENANYLGSDTNPYTILVKAKENWIDSCNINQSTKIICPSAFLNCYSLTSITVPESVVSIGKAAFRYCSALESLTLPFLGASREDKENAYLGYIFNASEHSTYSPASLKNIVITNATEIGKNAFKGWENVTSISLPANLTSIGEYAFYGCKGLTEINIPETAVNIGDYAFCGCSAITAITLPEKLNSISNSMFEGCSSLNRIDIPDGITSIGNSAFYNCTKLAEVNLPASLITIGSSAFRSAILRTVVIPDGVTSIGNGAFYGCGQLRAVTLSAELTSIGDEAFAFCQSIVTITVPAKVQTIGTNAFDQCYKLAEVINHSTLKMSAGSLDFGEIAYTAIEVHNGDSKLTELDGFLFYTCNGVNYLLGHKEGYLGTGANPVLPESYNGENYIIYKNAFIYETQISSITIPKSVTAIQSAAFYYCNWIKNVYYTGSAEEWSQIVIDGANSGLTGATVNYNHVYSTES